MLDIVTNGYKLPFLPFSQPMIAKNHRSAFKHDKFVEESIDDIVHPRVRESIVCPTVCSPLMFENAKGKLRHVISAMSTSFLFNTSSDMRTWISFPPYLGRVILFFPFDLKSGFHHVFGLATACYVFTKLLRPLVKHWRSMGLHTIVYIDDGICASASKAEAETARHCGVKS